MGYTVRKVNSEFTRLMTVFKDIYHRSTSKETMVLLWWACGVAHVIGLIPWVKTVYRTLGFLTPNLAWDGKALEWTSSVGVFCLLWASRLNGLRAQEYCIKPVGLLLSSTHPCVRIILAELDVVWRDKRSMRDAIAGECEGLRWAGVGGGDASPCPQCDVIRCRRSVLSYDLLYADGDRYCLGNRIGILYPAGIDFWRSIRFRRA